MSDFSGVRTVNVMKMPRIKQVKNSDLPTPGPCLVTPGTYTLNHSLTRRTNSALHSIMDWFLKILQSQA